MEDFLRNKTDARKLPSSLKEGTGRCPSVAQQQPSRDFGTSHEYFSLSKPSGSYIMTSPFSMKTPGI